MLLLLPGGIWLGRLRSGYLLSLTRGHLVVNIYMLCAGTKTKCDKQGQNRKPLQTAWYGRDTDFHLSITPISKIYSAVGGFFKKILAYTFGKSPIIGNVKM